MDTLKESVIDMLNKWSKSKGSIVRFKESNMHLVGIGEQIEIYLEGDPFIYEASRYNLTDDFYRKVEEVLYKEFGIKIVYNFNGTGFEIK